MKKVTIDGRPYQVPEHWGELTQVQLEALLPLQLANPQELSPVNRGRLKARALMVLFPDLKPYVSKLSTSQWYSIGKLTNWVWTTKIDSKPFDSFTLIDADGHPVKYVLPEDNFSNTTAIEIAMANIYYLQFTRPTNKDPKAILLLIATLCRPERTDLKTFRKSVDWNADTREEYNTILAEERAVNFQRLPFGTVMAMSQYFEAMNGRFLSIYKDVYEPDPNAEEEAPMYQNGEGLITTLMDVAKSGTFGDFEKVGKQNGHTIWLYLRDNNLKVQRANLRAEKERMTA